MPFRYSTALFVLEMVKAKGNFNRMADRTARRDARALSAAELTIALRDNVDHPWKPPGGGFQGALIHDTVQSLDITVPLASTGRSPRTPGTPSCGAWASRRPARTSGSTWTGWSYEPTTSTGASAREHRWSGPLWRWC
jgi:hypothetical protein